MLMQQLLMVTAIPAGFNISTDAIILEGKESDYVNIIAVKEGNENLPKIQALVKALNSDEVKKYIEETYPDGAVVPAF